MIGISFEQIILLLVLALILFGPEKLPEIAEKIGKWVAKMRQASSELTQQYHQALNPPLPPPPSPFEVFFCSHCSHKMEQRSTFCPACGHRQEEEIPADDLKHPLPACTSCGRKLEPDSLFCPFCGHNLEKAGEHYPPPEPPPTPTLITCPRCARKMESDFLFCPGCGQAFDNLNPPKPLTH